MNLKKHLADEKEPTISYEVGKGARTLNHLIHSFILGIPYSGQEGLPVIRFHDCRHIAETIMMSHGIPSMIVAGMLGHSISILLNTYVHFIPTMQDQAAQLTDDILTPVHFELEVKSKNCQK
jgi:integrase